MTMMIYYVCDGKNCTNKASVNKGLPTGWLHKTKEEYIESHGTTYYWDQHFCKKCK